MSRNAYIFILTLFLASCGQKTLDRSQEVGTFGFVLQKRDSILSELTLKLSDNKLEGEALYEPMITLLEQSKTQPKKLIPFSSTDSIVLFAFLPANSSEYAVDRPLRRQRKLTPKEAQSIFNIVNNPFYFHWAECGTVIEEHRLSYYYQGKSTAHIDIACNDRFLIFQPSNLLSRHGGLTEVGLEVLKVIVGK